jgi:alpha-L-fucosidase
MKKGIFILTLLIVFSAISCQQTATQNKSQAYQPTWESLKQHQTPKWLRDGKFGIYTHWGVYSVPAHGTNATWFSYGVYRNEDGKYRKWHEENYGPLSEFGYKDYIPLFKAEKFDADEWAELFQKAGAMFAGPVAEHHDGFAMWDTRWSEWNAAKMGPKRDIVGELEKAIKSRGMKYVTAFHHAANWDFFPVWDKRYDCSDPKYADLYGQIHAIEEERNEEFLDEWYGKIIEVIEKYSPDFIWFDFALDRIREDLVKDMVAYYYNHAVEKQKDVVITYKGHDLPPGVALRDLELGQERDLTHHEWITDTSVDDQGAWGYVVGAGFKSVDRLVDNLVDRVSKNGYLLLNVGPKADGTIPEGAKTCLLGIGKWLEVNGEAIYGTTSWTKSGEGPTMLEELDDEIGFNEEDLQYTGKDIRFTVKGNTLYAIALDWPGEEVLINSLVWIGDKERRAGIRRYPGYHIYKDEIQSISMLGDGQPLEWELTPIGLKIKTPENKPCDHAFVFKIVRETDSDGI